MSEEILINVTPRETRVALVENGMLQEVHVERATRRGYVGNAPSQLMRQRQAISMAVAMLQGDAASLLCDDPACAVCNIARKFTAEQR